MAGVQEGVLLIADISGYTNYLGGVELEHCHDVLAKLLEVVSQQTSGVLTVAKLEGDAVFCYDSRNACDVEMFVSTIEASYYAFVGLRRDIELNRACPCDACRQVPALDLKVIAHYGAFVEETIAGRSELMGTDVVLAHRLLKNSVIDSGHARGYALVTEACIEHFGLGTSDFAKHTEVCDDIGRVECWVLDLDERWREEQERSPVVVTSEESILTFQRKVPGPPPVVWEYLTAPEKKVLWRIYDKRIDAATRHSTRGVGSVTHCVMRLGQGKAIERCVDWKPYRYHTFTQHGRLGEFMYTTELEPLPSEGYTLVTTRFRPVNRRQRVTMRLGAKAYRRFFEKCNDKFVELLVQEAARGGGGDSPASS